MGKKLIMFGCIAATVMMLGNAAVALEIKVDIARVGYPDTEKPGYTIWSPYNDEDRHDKTLLANVDGTGVDIWASASHDGDLSGWRDSTPGVEPICNTGFWIFNYKEMDIYLAFVGLDPGEYTLKTYHRHPDGMSPMPAIEAVPNDQGWLGGDPCTVGGVTQIPMGEGNDVNVGIPGDPILDDDLPGSVVKFVTDGTSVLVIYRNPSSESSVPVINAFILTGAAGPSAAAPSPAHDGTLICPDVELSWFPGKYADTHDVYFGTDWDDVNDATTALDPNNVFVGNQPGTTYDPTGLLALGQTYYWRVDEVNDVCEPYLWKGNVWSFAVEEGKARVPVPSNGAGSLSTDAKLLSWTASCLATSHDVYFGQDFNDVNDATTATGAIFKGNQPGTTWSTPTLDLGKRYYWRIDEHTSLGVVKGDVWNFQTTGYPVMYLSFDGVQYEYLTGPYSDWTGNVTFQVDGTISFDETNPLYNTGGTSAFFDQSDGTAGLFRNDVPGAEIMDLAGPAYTIEMWANRQMQYGDVDEDDFAATLIRRYDLSYVLAIGEDGAVRYVHGGYDIDEGDPQQTVVESAPGRIGLGEWHHIAAVFDSTATGQEEKLYIDGLLEADSNYPGLNPTSDDDPLAIGMRVNPFRVGPRRIRNRFHGLIDEVRIVDLPLTPDEFQIRGDKRLAWLPDPYDHAKEVAPDVDFTWSPGDYASSHDVYLGTSWDDVNDATTASAVFQDHVEPNSYDPGNLIMETTYYWRVDEVNDSNATKWKGMVWRFNTVGYFVIDDMESYNDSDNLIYDTWLEDAGAVLDDFYAGDPAHSGEQSMWFFYYNDSGYSEVGRDLGGRNFTALGVTVMTLFFYGDALNDAGSTEEPYVGIDDGTHYAESRYTDTGNPISDIQEEEWHEWNMVLSDFNGVSLNNVQNIYIGFGQRGSSDEGGMGDVFIDDVRISGSKCIPELGPEWDWSDNCIVDLADVGIMADEWLHADAVLNTSVPTVGPVGWWELDDGIGTTATDSSGNGNTGTLEDSTTWVAGHIGTGAVEFSGDGGRIGVLHSPELMPESQVSVTAWIYATDSISGSVRVVAKGTDANDWEAYYIQFNSNERVTWTIRDTDHNNLPEDGLESDDLNLNEWIHVAGTYDGDVMKLYVNGQVADQATIGVVGILQDSNDLSIGNASDVNDRAFIGKIDDVRVYDYGLSAAEVAYLATGTTPTGYVPLDSQVNIYDEEDPGQKAVNFRDLAKFMSSWLEEKLWPE